MRIFLLASVPVASRQCLAMAPSPLSDLQAPFLNLVCDLCGRRGRYAVVRLIAERGGDAKLTDLLLALANCSRMTNSASIYATKKTLHHLLTREITHANMFMKALDQMGQVGRSFLWEHSPGRDGQAGVQSLTGRGRAGSLE